MIATVFPGTANGTVLAPPSKSMAHRNLICAALSNGVSKVQHIELSQDILATMDCIRALGGKCEEQDGTVTVVGIFAKESVSEGGITFPCRESGSTLRFFVPISMLFAGKKKFLGSEVLLSRPMSVYEELCKEQGIRFERAEGGIVCEGALHGGEISVKGSISSQFITGLLFTLPLLKENSIIHLIPPVESRSYIELTLLSLRKFGVQASWEDETTLYIPGGQTYQACDVVTEGDYSNAAFLDAFNLLGGNVQVTGLLADSLQGDKIYKKYYKLLGKNAQQPGTELVDLLVESLKANAACGNKAQEAQMQEAQMQEAQTQEAQAQEAQTQEAQAAEKLAARREDGLPTMDLTDCPDLGPVLMMLAGVMGGAHFTGTRRLKMKESDRGKVMCEELAKFGIQTQMEEDEITVLPSQIHTPYEMVCGHNDHRIVMSMVLLMTLTGGAVDDAHAVNKSFPSFYEVAKSLGIQVQVSEN